MYVVVIYSIIPIFIINTNYLFNRPGAWYPGPGVVCWRFFRILLYIVILRPGPRNPKPETRK